MKTWTPFQISQEEKQNILTQHRTQYDGWRTVQTQQPNTQPLYVQEFANDKEGIVVNNKGVVKPYTNFGINESLNEKEEVCNECGGQLYEGECTECGSMASLREKEECSECGEVYEDECTECGEMDESDCLDCDSPKQNIKKVADLGGKFDYVKEYDYMESAWKDMDENEPMEEFGSDENIEEDETLNDDWDKIQMEDWSNLDEELNESFTNEKNRILEMIHRVSSFN